MLSTDFEYPDVLKYFNSIFAGAFDIMGTLEYKKLLKEVKVFFIKCVKYLQSSTPVSKKGVIKFLTFLRLPERQQVKLDKLHVLRQRFPRVIADMNAIETEFLQYQATPDNEFPAYFKEDDKSMHTDYIWHQIS